MEKAPIISINLNSPIRSIGEFESVLALIPILAIGNILDAIREKVNDYLKLMGSHCDPELVEVYRARFHKALGAPSVRYKEEASPKEELKLVGLPNHSDSDYVCDKWTSTAPEEWFQADPVSKGLSDAVVLPDPDSKWGVQYVDRLPLTKLPL